MPDAWSQLQRRAVTMTASASLTLLACAAGVVALPGTAIASPHRGRGVAAAPVNRGKVATDLKQLTGYSASQLTAKAACGQPQPGQMSCLARVLSVKSTDRAAPLLKTPHATPMPVISRRTVKPALTSADLGTPAPAPGTAAFLQWAYDATWLASQSTVNDTIAIVDAYDDPNAASDMAAFRTANGLPACAVTTCFNQYNQSGQLIHQTGGVTPPSPDPTGGWEVEESLDLDAVSSLCPYCRIDLIEARNPNTFNLETAVSAANNLHANQISMSFGSDESPGSDPEGGHWAFAGTASLAAAGDDSYPGPDVGYPAAYPDVTAVGGTTLNQDASVARGFDESAWAKQSCSGGSTCGTESGCDTSQVVPSYQNGLTTDCVGRAYNDISADADPQTGLTIYDTVGGSQGCSHPCEVGGTSLATPLTAALEAITGVAGTSSPAWTYSDVSLLNDIVSGSDGTCPSNVFLLCTAAPGWDGPTGNGSISGDLVPGGPGIGGNDAIGVNGTDVTFSGGVYPNGLSTQYAWQYWEDGNAPTSGTQTPTTQLVGGQTLQGVSSTLCGQLTPDTRYDYSLVATNTSGTEDSYQGSFTTGQAETGPNMSSNPSITGTPNPGQTLTAQLGNWNDQSCNSAPTYQWQESASASGPWAPVSTASTYALTSADLGQYLKFTETENNLATPSLSTTTSSAIVGPVAVPTITTTTTTPTPTQTTTTSTTPTTTTPSGSGSGSGETVRFYRCTRTCTLLNTHGATSYNTTSADYGKYIKVVTTVFATAGAATAAAGDPSTVQVRWVGPITAPTAGVATIGATARIAATQVVRGNTHATLARVRVAKRAIKRTTTTLTLAVTRQGKVATNVWAYVIKDGAVISCTTSHALKRPLKLSIGLTKGETVKLVAVRA